ALNKARQAANTVKCLANLRSAGQAMQMYAAMYNGAIVGSANTSGAHLWRRNPTSGAFEVIAGYNTNNTPEFGPIEIYDWMAPVCNMLRIQLPSGNDGNDRMRFYRETA